MILAALLDAGLPFSDFTAEIEKIGLPEQPRLKVQRVIRGGVSASLFSVETENSPHCTRNLGDMLRILDGAKIDPDVRERAANAFRRIATCEAGIHGVSVDSIHFHELSGLDTIIDIVGVFAAVKLLGVDSVVASPVNVGSGVIECAHGILPVPAPATAKLLEGVPVFSRFNGELTTPTGALLLTELACSFGDMPLMTVGSIGHGAGYKELMHPNILRAFIGEQQKPTEMHGQGVVYHISTNIDDTEPRILGYLLERELEEGALDAYYEPVIMKKSRPGFVFNVLCNADTVQKAVDLIMSETGTLGVRIQTIPRFCIERRIETVDTVFGKIRVKLAITGGAVRSANPEYEDCALAARKKGKPLYIIIETAREAARHFISQSQLCDESEKER